MPSSDTETILDTVSLSAEANNFSSGGIVQPAHENNGKEPKVARKIWKWKLEGMTLVVVSVVILTLAITVALIVSILVGEPQVKPHGTVTSENEQCNHYGVEIMKTGGGNAVDAAVATALCITVARPDKASLAGCGLMLVRDRDTQVTSLFDFTCPAPSHPSFTDPTKPETFVGVPALVRGLHLAHKSFGTLPWSDLFVGALTMATKGFQLDLTLQQAALKAASAVPAGSTSIATSLAQLSGHIYIPAPELRSTLRALAKHGAHYFYADEASSSSFSTHFLSLMRDLGHEWSATDLQNYRVQQPKPIQMGFAGFTLDAFPSPSSAGPFLLTTLGNLELKNSASPLNPNALTTNDPIAIATMTHRLIELAKISTASVLRLGDPYDVTIRAAAIGAQKLLFSPDGRKSLVNGITDEYTSTPAGYPTKKVDSDIGDTGILVTDSDHFTVVLNLYLGSPFGTGQIVPSTGVHLNAALRLFSNPNETEPYHLNLLAPARHPLVPISPVHVSTTHRRCGVRVGLVATGGMWGMMDAVQVITNAALFLHSCKCSPIPTLSTTRMEFENPFTTEESTYAPRDSQGTYTPAADYGCINAQKGTDLFRIHSDVGILHANSTVVPVLYEPSIPGSLVRILTEIGHRMITFSDPWPGRVALAGWNGYTMISSNDTRGSWFMSLF